MGAAADSFIFSKGDTFLTGAGTFTSEPSSQLNIRDNIGSFYFLSKERDVIVYFCLGHRWRIRSNRARRSLYQSGPSACQTPQDAVTRFLKPNFFKFKRCNKTWID